MFRMTLLVAADRRRAHILGALEVGLLEVPPAEKEVLRTRLGEYVGPSIAGRDDLIGAQRLVYVLDLTEPNGLFLARDFIIRDGDTLYVSEAPATQWNKAVSAFFGSLVTPVASLDQLAN